MAMLSQLPATISGSFLSQPGLGSGASEAGCDAGRGGRVQPDNSSRPRTGSRVAERNECVGINGNRTRSRGAEPHQVVAGSVVKLDTRAHAERQYGVGKRE